MSDQKYIQYSEGEDRGVNTPEPETLGAKVFRGPSPCFRKGEECLLGRLLQGSPEPVGLPLRVKLKRTVDLTQFQRLPKKLS